jgi:molybdate transport system substrate-binding protein
VSDENGEASGELMVFAAASLTDAYRAVARDFEEAHPKVKVVLNFAGSQSLRTQIEQGATPQVFASANQKHMTRLREQGLINDFHVFAQNEMVIVVPRSNPGRVSSLEDLATTSHIVLAGPQVPAGSYAEKVLARAQAGYGSDFAKRVIDRVVSRELDVRSALQKVVLGEANAAVVYATDAASVGDSVRSVELPAEYNVVAEYPIAKINGSGNGQLGQLFIKYVLSDAGQRRLAEFGFKKPPADGEMVANTQ